MDELATPCAQLGLTTLQDYINLNGDQCSVGILNFARFSFSASTTTGNTSLYSASNIAVNTTFDGTNTGFSFSYAGSGQFQVAAGFDAIYRINYDYVIDAGPVGMAADLGVDPPFGSFSIRQDICADSNFGFTNAGMTCQVDGPGAPPVQSFSVDNTSPPLLPQFDNYSSLVLNPPVTSFAYIHNTIILNGGQTGAGFDSVTARAAIVDSVPEPASYGLLLSGGIVIAGLFKKRQAR